MKTIIFLILLLPFNLSLANTIGSETGLELPRYVSLKSNDTNVRVGPSKNYPISINYIKRNFPVKIIEEYSEWRKIIDFQGNRGWIHKSLLKGERNGIIISNNKNDIEIYNTVHGKIIGYVEKGSLVNILKCKINWCEIHKNKHQGWVKKEFMWGVKRSEEYNLSILQVFFDYYYRSINFIDMNLN